MLKEFFDNYSYIIVPIVFIVAIFFSIIVGIIHDIKHCYIVEVVQDNEVIEVFDNVCEMRVKDNVLVISYKHDIFNDCYYVLPSNSYVTKTKVDCNH